MLKERKENNQINEEEAIRAFLAFRSFSPDKQAFAIAFINGMEFQKRLDEATSQHLRSGFNSHRRELKKKMHKNKALSALDKKFI